MTTELLAPAGGQEALVAAVQSGADAVYMGFGAFNARRSARNFSDEEFRAAVSYCHLRGVKVYLTLNTLVTDRELPLLVEEARIASECGVDAILVQDWGVLAALREIIPDVPLHASTQMSLHTLSGAQESARLGMTRAVLARELNREEIAEICEKSPIEIEAFVHGAMCMSFSGRCLLSAYLTGRDANRGACAQPCRWNYHVVESKREGQYFPVEETDEGTYIFNAKDLCMIDHLQELLDAGVDSLKIEGRNKSAYYVAIITNAYRAALDAAMAGQPAPEWALREVVQVSHREYCTGFFYGRENAAQRYADSSYVRNCDVVAVVNRWEQGRLYLTQRNRFFAGDSLEIVAAGQPVTVAAQGLENEDGESIETANHAMMQCSIACETAFPAGSVVRKPVE